MAESIGEIVKALVVNLAIACGKAVAAALSGSGAMLAETLHSLADCGNQVLLLVGVRSSHKPPDARHPLGHGRAMYFYSFIVALLLFFGGGVFSIREGIAKLAHPEPVDSVELAVGIVLFSLALDGYSLASNLREINRRRGAATFWRYLRDTKDSDLIMVFGENAAGVLGLCLALAALVLARATGNGRWDGAGSLAIGLVLVGVATFLAREVKSLLVGEAADPAICGHVAELAAELPDIQRVFNVITIQQGPGEILVAAKLEMQPGLDTARIVATINELERRLKDRAPDVRWSFIEPDDQD
ncbi:MAG TPA: cation diffusion facilitator family transporter [Kofleriaceae bacterium]|nr:cation diffusion facilitator family transporter [Kofleriaceae bacterium]